MSWFAMSARVGRVRLLSLEGTRRAGLPEEIQMAHGSRTVDDDGRVRVGPASAPDWLDRIWPRRHGKWWNWDHERRQTQSVNDLLGKLTSGDAGPVPLGEAEAKAKVVEAVAQTARDRAEAADRRATTMASGVAIAASFTLSGAGLLLDGTRWEEESILRVCFAVGLLFTTLAFVLTAIYALRALVSKRTRTWNWNDPTKMWLVFGEKDPGRFLMLDAAQRLSEFASNWEISDLKNRNVDNALRCLIAALAGIALLAAIAALAAI